MDHHHVNQPGPSTKVERRIVEKNRRDLVKSFCEKLNSLLPNYNPKELLPLPDQIDEAIRYIKSLETKVKVAQQKKESLLRKKTARGSCSSASEAKGSLKSPKIEIHEMGSLLQVILTCGVDDRFIFIEIIRILDEENVEVINANSSIAGDSVLHVVQAEIRQSLVPLGAAKVSERLEKFVNGSVSDLEIEPELWGIEIGNEIWGLLDPPVSKGSTNPS